VGGGRARLTGEVGLSGESAALRELGRVGREGGGEHGRAGESEGRLGLDSALPRGVRFPFSFHFSFLNLFFLFSKYSSKFPRCPK
jgi:hypothetical protein